ncbi:MAG TPA: addiction module protein [Pirellulaceae bacterium]|nr:addiction module protein [Pirellulaceae bacterium]
MSNYESILSAASQMPVVDRLRLIDELASSIPDDQPPQLSDAWLREIDWRSNEIDSGAVATERWADIRARLFAKHGVDGVTRSQAPAWERTVPEAPPRLP